MASYDFDAPLAANLMHPYELGISPTPVGSMNNAGLQFAAQQQRLQEAAQYMDAIKKINAERLGLYKSGQAIEQEKNMLNFLGQDAVAKSNPQGASIADALSKHMTGTDNPGASRAWDNTRLMQLLATVNKTNADAAQSHGSANLHNAQAAVQPSIAGMNAANALEAQMKAGVPPAITGIPGMTSLPRDKVLMDALAKLATGGADNQQYIGNMPDGSLGINRNKSVDPRAADAIMRMLGPVGTAAPSQQQPQPAPITQQQTATKSPTDWEQLPNGLWRNKKTGQYKRMAQPKAQ